jgi:polyphenol oxidase
VKVQSGTTQDEIKDTDALITTSKGLCISVMSADCVPVLLYDPVKRAIGAVHAGWRGTVSKILTLTVQAMLQHYGTQPADLVAAIGPSICPEVYEVGEEVIMAVEQTFGTKDSLITRENGPGKGHFNLWEANRIQLLALGVKSENIEVAGICTYQHSDEFFSARRSGNRAGRFSAGILLREG